MQPRSLPAWAGRYLGGNSADDAAAKIAAVASEYKGGALARSISGEPLAVALSVDGHPRVIDAAKEEGGSDLGPNPTRTVEGRWPLRRMTMNMYARRKGWDLESVEIRVTRAKSEDAHAPHALEKEIPGHWRSG